MGYVENNLLKEEQVVFKTQHHWIIFIWPVIFFILGCSIFGSALKAGKDGAGLGGLGSIFILGGIAFFIGQLISMKTNEFAVTNKRIVIKVGLIRRTTLEMNREKVESIGVEQSILGRMLNYGTLIIRGTGATKQPFKHIADPIQFKKLVQEK